MLKARDFQIKKLDTKLQVKEIAEGSKVAISTVSRLLNEFQNDTVTLGLARKVWDFLIIKEEENG